MKKNGKPLLMSATLEGPIYKDSDDLSSWWFFTLYPGYSAESNLAWLLLSINVFRYKSSSNDEMYSHTWSCIYCVCHI